MRGEWASRMGIEMTDPAPRITLSLRGCSKLVPRLSRADHLSPQPILDAAWASAHPDSRLRRSSHDVISADRPARDTNMESSVDHKTTLRPSALPALIRLVCLVPGAWCLVPGQVRHRQAVRPHCRGRPPAATVPGALLRASGSDQWRPLPSFQVKATSRCGSQMYHSKITDQW